MKSMIVAAAVAATTAACAVPAAADERVFNGGFEDAGGVFAGWAHTTFGLIPSNNPLQAHSGENAVLFGSVEEEHPDTLSQTLSTVAGQSYMLSFWLANRGQDELGLNTAFHVSFGNTPLYTFLDTSDPGGIKYSNYKTSVVATGASTMLSFSGFNYAGYYYLDDVSVSGPAGGVLAGDDRPGVPEPAAWAMMLLGFGGVGAVTRGRRRIRLRAAA